MKFDLNSYYDISKVVDDKDYAISLGLIVKKVGSLYMIKYDKSQLMNTNVDTLGKFRSCITDGKKIVCYSPDKAYKYLDFVENVDFSSITLEEFVEGTMINLFYYNGEWNCATRGNIGAKCKFFKDYPKTYRILFLEAMEDCNLEFEMLNKEYCYTFILQHPENRIVVPFSEKKLILLSVYKCVEWTVEKLCVEWELQGFDPNVKIDKIKKIENTNNSYSELFENYTSLNEDYKKMGIVIRDGNKRTKIWNPNYLKVKCLRGNNPKIQFQYYNLLKDKKLIEFIFYYPEYKETFDNYKLELFQWTEQLWSNYKRCYIYKQKPLGEFPKQFRSCMYTIHNNYLNTLRPNNKKVDKLYVINYVNNLEAAQLMYFINYTYRVNLVDNEKVKLELTQMTH